MYVASTCATKSEGYEGILLKSEGRAYKLALCGLAVSTVGLAEGKEIVTVFSVIVLGVPACIVLGAFYPTESIVSTRFPNVLCLTVKTILEATVNHLVLNVYCIDKAFGLRFVVGYNVIE